MTLSIKTPADIRRYLEGCYGTSRVRLHPDLILGSREFRDTFQPWLESTAKPWGRRGIIPLDPIFDLLYIIGLDYLETRKGVQPGSYEFQRAFSSAIEGATLTAVMQSILCRYIRQGRPTYVLPTELWEVLSEARVPKVDFVNLPWSMPKTFFIALPPSQKVQPHLWGQGTGWHPVRGLYVSVLTEDSPEYARIEAAHSRLFKAFPWMGFESTGRSAEIWGEDVVNSNNSCCISYPKRGKKMVLTLLVTGDPNSESENVFDDASTFLHVPLPSDVSNFETHIRDIVDPAITMSFNAHVDEREGLKFQAEPLQDGQQGYDIARQRETMGMALRIALHTILVMHDKESVLQGPTFDISRIEEARTKQLWAKQDKKAQKKTPTPLHRGLGDVRAPAHGSLYLSTYRVIGTHMLDDLREQKSKEAVSNRETPVARHYVKGHYKGVVSGRRISPSGEPIPKEQRTYTIKFIKGYERGSRVTIPPRKTMMHEM